MSGGCWQRAFFPNATPFFLTYPMYACISFAFPWGKVARRSRDG